MKKNILLTIYRFGKEYGGAERDTFYFFNYMKEFFNIKIITKKMITSPFLEKIYNWNLKIKGIGRIKWIISLLNDYMKIKRESKNIDVFYGVYFGFDELFTISTLLVAKKLKKPFVFNPHTHLTSFWEGKFLKFLYKNSDIIIARTESEKKWLSRFTSKKIKVIPLGIEIFDENNLKIGFKEKYGIKGKIVLFIGRKTEYKNYKLLVESANFIWEEFPNTYFVFIGEDTPLSYDYFKKIKDKRIINIGFVNEEEKYAALKECDIFCLPSEQESFGIVYLEAWLFKKPIIALNIPPINEIITNNKDGILVNKDSYEIVNAIKKILKNEEKMKILGENGYTKLKEFFNIEKKKRRDYFLFKEISNKKFSNKLKMSELFKILLWK
jgi:glycosyltransferase involved in cell wall biosynthesis